MDLPVIMGEWGAADKKNLAQREYYFNYFATECMKREILPVNWDDGGNHRLLNRHELSWYFPSLVQIVMDVQEQFKN